MTRPARIPALKDIATIRSAQERVAELDLQRLLSERRRLKGAQDQAVARRRAETLAWMEAMRAKPMDMALAGAWSGRVLQTDAELKLLEQRLDVNQTRVDAASAERVRAQARHDVADTLVATALRTRDRQREERRQQDLSDRFNGGQRRS